MTEPKRRKRNTISCTLCRKRKIRCNRETPCSNCLRSKHAACIYETDPRPIDTTHNAPLQPRPVESSQISIVSTSTEPSVAAFTPKSMTSVTSIELQTMKARISELEDELVKTRGVTASPPSVQYMSPAYTDNLHLTTGLAGSIDVLRESRDFGQPHAISRGIAHKNRVFGQSHWMNGFVIFKDVMEMMEPELKSGTTTLLMDVTRAKVLARRIKSQRSPSWPLSPTNDLPPRDICDALVEGYLRTIEPLYRILHIPSFWSDYHGVWTNVEQSKVAVMMQLKLVLAIGSIVYDEKCSMRGAATRWIYEAQTWLSSPAFKSQLGIKYLQNSILLLLARELVDVGGELCWISAGAVLRAAVHIGLHRDPAQLPRLSTLESEIRRRLWNTILELNLQFSLIAGGPCYVSLEDFTTRSPGNFDDEQLLVEDAVAAPDTKYTMTTASIVLRTTFPIRLAIVKFLNDSTSTGTYEETLRIDTQLRAAYKNLRRMLQTNKTGSCPPAFVIDAVDFIMHRYISSLHIPFFNPALHEAAYAFSRNAVTDSSLKIWNIACPTPEAVTEPDIVRLCRCGAGFFRAFTFHALSFLAIELCTQLQAADSVPRPDLVNICEDASSFTLRTIEAGETGIKGYILMRVLAAQVDGIKRRIEDDKTSGLLVRAAEEAAKHCIPVLERIAGLDQEVTTTGAVVDDLIGDMSLNASSDFLQDWDLVMSDVFNFDSQGGFDMFFGQ